MKSIGSILVVVLLSMGTLLGEETQKDYHEIDKMDDWGFSVTPYALLAAQSTDVEGEKLRQSFSDLSSMTNAGFQIIAAARYKKLTLSFDGTFATLGSDLSQGGLAVDVSIKQRIFDLKLSYMVYDNFKFKEGNTINGWSSDIGMGTKYWKNDVNIDYTLSFGDDILLQDNISLPQEWWDLMLGVRTKFVLNKKVNLGIAFNAGGFGIGNSSKFAHDFTYINNFRVLNWLSVNAGFRSFGYNRIDDEVETKVNVLGPLLGVSLFL